MQSPRMGPDFGREYRFVNSQMDLGVILEEVNRLDLLEFAGSLFVLEQSGVFTEVWLSRSNNPCACARYDLVT